jgi:hypothetical protein
MSYETLMFMTFSAEIIQGVTKPSLNLAFTNLRKKIEHRRHKKDE